jgi:hypothetical protein
MQPYETSATVEGHGEVHVVGVPFAPGTKVDVAISPMSQMPVTDQPLNDRLARLLSALDKARNIEPVGALNRDELYDRNGLR